MKTQLRNEYGAFSSEGMAMLNEVETSLKPLIKKWLETFSQDEIFSVIATEASLQLSEITLSNACKKRLKEKAP